MFVLLGVLDRQSTSALVEPLVGSDPPASADANPCPRPLLGGGSVSGGREFVAAVHRASEGSAGIGVVRCAAATAATFDRAMVEGILIAVIAGLVVAAILGAIRRFATRRPAASSDEHLDLLRRRTSAAEEANLLSERQAAAAEAASAAAERQAAEKAKPRLWIERLEGEEMVGGSAQPDAWTILLHNRGQAPATLVEAKVNLAPQPLFLEPAPNTPIEPGENRLFSAETPTAILEDGADGRLPFPLSLTYSGPTGYRENMQATLRGKGDRWIVIEAERHKDAGPAPRNVAPW